MIKLKNYLFTFILSMLVLSCSGDSDPDPGMGSDAFIDSFEGTGDLIDYTTNNENAVPSVTRFNGRYRAELTDNTDNVTLHFHEDQGRLDAKPVTFPFEFIARNIGIGSMADSQQAPAHQNDPFNFCGVQVHVLDLSSPNSSHVVVGHRGSTGFTIEGKNTLNGSSSVNDNGQILSQMVEQTYVLLALKIVRSLFIGKFRIVIHQGNYTMGLETCLARHLHLKVRFTWV